MRRKWRKKIGIGEKTFQIINCVFMILLMMLTLYPFLYVAFASISEASQIIRHTGPLLFPKGFSLESYNMVFQNPMIIRGYLNTLGYVTVGTLLNLFMTVLGAYVLSRKGPILRNIFMFFIVFTMYFSGGLIPLYLLVKSMNLMNNPLAIILPGAISTMNLIIMRTYFQQIPDSLEESARIDGANDYTILFRVIVPLSGPVIAVMILFYGVGHWNAWFYAMIFIRERALIPLQLVLREILIQNDTQSMTTSISSGDKDMVSETIKYATIIVATLPILTIYPFLQKYFVKGIMIGAIKG